MYKVKITTIDGRSFTKESKRMAWDWIMEKPNYIKVDEIYVYFKHIVSLEDVKQ